MTIRLVHGIRTCDPMKHFDGLEFCLQERGFDTHVLDYGYILVPLSNKWAEAEMRRHCEPNDTWILYSNAAWAGYEVAEELQPRHVVLISPALRNDVVWPECVETVTIFYSTGDNAIPLGSRWSKFMSAMPWRRGTPHGWGNLGLTGPKVYDPRHRTFLLGEHVEHSWYEYPEKVRLICSSVANVLRRKL